MRSASAARPTAMLIGLSIGHDFRQPARPGFRVLPSNRRLGGWRKAESSGARVRGCSWIVHPDGHTPLREARDDSGLTQTEEAAMAQRQRAVQEETQQAQ